MNALSRINITVCYTSNMKTFSEKIVELALQVPAGYVTTYGHLARRAGVGGQAARSVNAILSKAHNKGVLGIPFHRIVYAGGRIWSNETYRGQRIQLYKAEGIELNKKGFVVDFEEKLWKFK